MARLTTFIVSIALLAGCATAPEKHSFQNSRAYDKGFDEVWEKVVEYFATNNIEIKNIAKDSGVIYAERTSFDNSVADCGSPGLSQVVGRTATFNVFVSDQDGATQVSVNSRFSEVRRFDYNNWNVECNSRGVLEKTVLDAIEG